MCAVCFPVGIPLVVFDVCSYAVCVVFSHTQGLHLQTRKNIIINYTNHDHALTWWYFGYQICLWLYTALCVYMYMYAYMYMYVYVCSIHVSNCCLELRAKSCSFKQIIFCKIR